jgi:hypothetical protein
MVLLMVEAASLAVALLSGVMYSASGRRGWRIALWAAAILLLLPSALGAASLIFFRPTFLPAALLMFLAALFSLSVRWAGRDAAGESRSPLQTPIAPQAPSWTRLLFGVALACAAGASAFFLLSVSWGMALAILVAGSVGAALLLRSPVSAPAVPAAVWCGAVVANIFYGAANARLDDPIFWGGMLEFGAILIVIAGIPALIGVAIGALLSRWLPSASA